MFLPQSLDALMAVIAFTAIAAAWMLIQVARTNRNAVVRRQAIFWLGQSKDPRALSFFEEILTK